MEETENNEEMRMATRQDIDDLASKFEISEYSCSYDDFLRMLMGMVHSFFGEELLSNKVNLDTLKVLIGQPYAFVRTIKLVWEQHQSDIKSKKDRYNKLEEKYDRTKTKLRDLRHNTKLQQYMSAAFIGAIKAGEGGMFHEAQYELRHFERGED